MKLNRHFVMMPRRWCYSGTEYGLQPVNSASTISIRYDGCRIFWFRWGMSRGHTGTVHLTRRDGKELRTAIDRVALYMI